MSLIKSNMVLRYGIFIALIKMDVVHGILGGREVNTNEAPFQVSYADVCGAVLIQPEWAVTTAHCGADGTFVRVGSKHRLKGAKIQIRYHLIHPLYGIKHEFDYDVQLLKLYKKLKFSQRLNSLPFCDKSCEGQVKVFGWGYSEEKGEYSDVLQMVVLTIIPLKHCQNVKLFWYNKTLTSRMFCAAGKGRDACQGDSGGAAVSKNHLVGLSSFGYGCGRNVPGVYTNLNHPKLKAWIYHVIEDKINKNDDWL